jgi:toxin-antitoxin system PIN domain toxin
MTTYLLDANVLIALAVADHAEHRRASTWAAGVDSFAMCPITEGALVRFVTRVGGSARDGLRLLEAIGRRKGYEFWPDSLSYREAAPGHVVGHRQVTDAYLAALARSHPGALLATMDKGLSAAVPDATELLPAGR